MATHFKGKGPLEHVIEAQAEGIISAAEVHGTEPPGHLSAACDTSRDTAIVLSLAWILLSALSLSFSQLFSSLLILGSSWLLWKTGRTAWLGWFRLERLHRVLAQERYEIEHHRQQERDELRVLYAAKGFEGKLLEDVLDVLMADNDRLLKVMVEEELGLTLAAYEHPLKQGLGAAIGAFATIAGALALFAFWPAWGILTASAILIGFSSAFSAVLAQNDPVPAIVWNLGLAVLSLGCFYFLFHV